MADSGDSKVWTVLSLVTALGAAALARMLVDKGWRAATGKQPPVNPGDPNVRTREAVAWAIVSGVFVALARMLAERRAAHYYVRTSGHLPPQLEQDLEQD